MVQVQLYLKFGTFCSFCFRINCRRSPLLEAAALHLHLHPGHPVFCMGGLTDALIEEQAFRQEFEEAVRAEIKHVPWVPTEQSVSGFFRMGSPGNGSWFFSFSFGTLWDFRKETNKKLRAGWRFSRGYHLDISTNRGTFWSNKLTPNISMENSNLSSPTSSSWEDNP